MSITSVVVVNDGGVIKSDMKSCPTFAISVTSLPKFCISIRICRTRPEPRPNSSGSVRVLHVHGFGSVRFEFYIFLHVSSSSVRFCQNVGSSSVRSVRVRFDSHLYKFVESNENLSKKVRVRFGFVTLMGSVWFEFYVFST